MNILYQSHWVLNGFAHGIVIYLIGRFAIFGYREHSYLYQFDRDSQALKNAVDLILPWANKIPAKKYREFIDNLLIKADYHHGWDQSHFISLQCIYLLGSFFLCYLLLNVFFGLSIWLSITTSLVFGFLPLSKLFDKGKKRINSCRRELPYFIDYLSLTMGAGLDFNQGLAAVIADSPTSHLKHEFAQLLRNMKLGMSRGDALLDLNQRVDTPGMRIFTQTLSLAIKMGSDIAQTLSIMGETMQTKRFQKAEEEAGKISIRMMIPMMIFVMPATIIILLGPMILEWIKNT